MKTLTRVTQVQDWFEINLEKSSCNEVSLRDMYAGYCGWCEHHECVPVSKRKFSGELKEHFKNEIDSEKIVILNRNGLLFQGLHVIN